MAQGQNAIKSHIVFVYDTNKKEKIMKTLTKILVCLLIAASLMTAFVACTGEEASNDTTTSGTVKDPAGNATTTSGKAATTAPNTTDKPAVTGTDLFNGGENDAQSGHMGEFVYWNDQNWEGSVVSVDTAVIDDNGVITISFTHTGSNGFGVQLFYNPEGTVNGDTYEVSFKIKSTVDASITVNGEIIVLTANEEKTVTYTATADMHPDVTDYQYGDSIIDIQFGVGHAADTISDIVDGTYTISEVTTTKTEA